MATIQDMVREFHEKFGLTVNDSLTLPSMKEQDLRLELMKEEVRELAEAVLGSDDIGIADALGDIVYVAYGTALTYGINLDAVLAEIHRSNITKLGPDGKPILRSDGKILKGPNYESPNLGPIVNG